MRDDELDVALREYVAREPLAGIERRVMARLQDTRRPRIWFWAVCGAVALMLVIVAIALRPAAVELPAITARVEKAADKPFIPERKIRPVRRGKLPKRAQFPSPEPLTDGERALLRFIQRDHDQALVVLDARREDRQPPLVTEELP